MHSAYDGATAAKRAANTGAPGPGVAEPSVQDQALTRTLAEALALIDVKVLDHFIVAPGACLSFAERGLI